MLVFKNKLVSRALITLKIKIKSVTKIHDEVPLLTYLIESSEFCCEESESALSNSFIGVNKATGQIVSNWFSNWYDYQPSPQEICFCPFCGSPIEVSKVETKQQS